MHSIYMRTFEEQLAGRDWKKTLHGSTDRNDAIAQMVLLCGELVSALQKTGKRATIDAGVWDGRLVMRVINNSKVVESYSLLN